MGGLVFIGVVVLVAYLYLRTISRSRSHLESLHQPPDDLRRAGDDQQPPHDGSAGFV